jgi:hypothetical protein
MMDAAQIRSMSVRGIDEILGSFWSRRMDPERRKLLTATRNVVMTSDQVVNLILAEFQRLPLNQEESSTMTKKASKGKERPTLSASETKALQSRCESMGLDWSLFQRLLVIAPVVAQKLLDVLDTIFQAIKTTNTDGMKAHEGTGCDHMVCAEQVLTSALETAQLAADHYCQCCEECCPNEPTDE